MGERDDLDFSADGLELLLELCDELLVCTGWEELKDDHAAVVLSVVEAKASLDRRSILAENLLDLSGLLCAIRHVDCNNIVRHVIKQKIKQKKKNQTQI